MKKVIICADVYDKKTWYAADVYDVLAYLKQQFDVFPSRGRIYHNAVSEQTDVTPKNEQDIKNLANLEGVFYVVIYPSEPISIAMWIYYAVMAVAVAYSVYAILTMPKPPKTGLQGSSNNELQGRSNQARLGSRRPDIYGTVRSYPDLIGAIFNYYSPNEGDREIEECIMEIGRGNYEIHDCRDGETAVEGISGMDVSIYEPNASINNADTPIYKVGESFTHLPLVAVKSSAINGQSLQKPSDDLIIDNTTLYFESGGIVKSTDGDLNFLEYFAVDSGIEIKGALFGESDGAFGGSSIANNSYEIEVTTDADIANLSTFKKVQIVGAVFSYTTGSPAVTKTANLDGLYDIESIVEISTGYRLTLLSPKQVNYNWNHVVTASFDATYTLKDSDLSANLDGIYSISSISATQITLANASVINDEWGKLSLIYDGSTIGVSPEITLSVVENKWVGWFNFDDPDATHLAVNFYFPQGLYTTTDSGKERSGWIEVACQYQNVTDEGVPIGTVQEVIWRIFKTTKSSFGITNRVALPNAGKCRFRLAKIAEKDWNRPINECKVKEVYATHTLLKNRYAGSTLVRTRQVATDGALSLKERKLNCLVTRKLKVDGIGDLVPTRDAGQAIFAMALDQHIGRRAVNELDIAQIKATMADIAGYFESSVATEFSYTFDDANLSFEEMVGMVASAVFCEAYRFGNKLRVKFEKPQMNSVLLFNHRNKVPKSEKRTVNFGIPKDYDGIALEYTSPDTDERIFYRIAFNRTTGVASEGDTALNPLEIKTSGIRNHAVAKTRAWREWQKLQYQYKSVEFEALDESSLLIRNDRILVADGTSLKAQEGEVIAVEVLRLTLSQTVELDPAKIYYCHLQMSDGSVDAVQCVADPDFYNVIILNHAPKKALVVDADRYVKTLYAITTADEMHKEAFLLTEMSTNGDTNRITAINYDGRYYAKDHAFI